MKVGDLVRVIWKQKNYFILEITDWGDVKVGPDRRLGTIWVKKSGLKLLSEA